MAPGTARAPEQKQPWFRARPSALDLGGRVSPGAGQSKGEGAGVVVALQGQPVGSREGAGVAMARPGQNSSCSLWAVPGRGVTQTRVHPALVRVGRWGPCPYFVSSVTSTSVGAVMGAFECPAVGSSVFSSPLVELITWGRTNVSVGQPRGHRPDLVLVPHGSCIPEVQPQALYEVSTQGSRMVPSGSVLSAPKQPRHTEVGSPGCLGGILAQGPRHTRWGRAWGQPAPAPLETRPREPLAPWRWCCGRTMDTALGPQHHRPHWAQPPPTWGAPRFPRVLPAGRGSEACAAPGANPSHQTKDGAGTGNWDLPETPVLRPLPPGQHRSSRGSAATGSPSCSAPARRLSPTRTRGGAANSHRACPGYIKLQPPQNKPETPVRHQHPAVPGTGGGRGRFAERAGAATRTWRGRDGGVEQSTSWALALPQPRHGSRAHARD